MKKIFGLLLVFGLCGCSSKQDGEGATKADLATTIAQPELPGADAVAGNSVLTGSLAGYYVESFAGANTHSYKFKFANSAYRGVYEEYQDGAHKTVILKDVIADETAKTLTFDQNGTRLTGTVTSTGFELGEEVFERREAE
ncbi:MAG: hypothetical protein K0R82_2445 [Flavipsychrobacter sp.]|jgi:hypothetical protein|nr:hypothetical protein [Flavipsychrobacter sp.]